MLCYKDRTFCEAECANEKCSKKLTLLVKLDAEKWWGKPGAPIMTDDLSPHCPVFEKVRT